VTIRDKENGRNRPSGTTSNTLPHKQGKERDDQLVGFALNCPLPFTYQEQKKRGSLGNVPEKDELEADFEISIMLAAHKIRIKPNKLKGYGLAFNDLIESSSARGEKITRVAA